MTKKYIPCTIKKMASLYLNVYTVNKENENLNLGEADPISSLRLHMNAKS